jgi:radical SAM superfamily enzyme YgiQ (UPF0313 family)
MENYFEQGPIRPPSEASSLLIRVTRNCPWNKCAFCHSYRRSRFELRSVEEVKKDIQSMRVIADRITALSWKWGEGGAINRNVLRHLSSDNEFQDDCCYAVASWLYFGGENVFLQDANSLILKTPDLLEILYFLKEKFPNIQRITSYCRSHTAARKTPDEFRQLKEAGLSRIHIGMESGCDAVLSLVNKGVTAAEHIQAGCHVKEGGIELSEYIMPGLGGVQFSNQHAVDTAKVLNTINPDFIRLRTLHVVPGTKLDDLMKKGEFQPLHDDDIVKEIKLFIDNLDVGKSFLISDHILNLLENLEGRLPQDKKKLLSVIEKYFELSAPDRPIFRLGRRLGVFRRTDDLADREIYWKLKAIVDDYESRGANLDGDIYKTMNNFI